VRIGIFLDNQFLTNKSISSSRSVVASLSTFADISSNIEIKLGAKSALTSDQIQLYLHELKTFFLNSQNDDELNTSTNFLMVFSVKIIV
jgi:hypothetical protein